LTDAGAPAASFARLWTSLWKAPYVTPEQLELCRLTFARLHQDQAELDATNILSPPSRGADERRAMAIAGKATGPSFSAADKAILLFAEYYWLDPQSITDDAADAVKAEIGEAGLVFLIEALGCIDARVRAARVLRDLNTIY
jgi:hypothetical protein